MNIRIEKILILILSGIIFIIGAAASAGAAISKAAFTLDVKDRRISIQAKNAGVMDILQALESKTGIKVVIYDGVVTNNVSLDIKDIPFHSLDTLLQKMSLSNTAIVYDKQLAGMAIYVLPEGKSIRDVLKENPTLVSVSEANFATGSTATHIKGKEIASDVRGKNKVSIRYVKNEIMLKFHRGTTEQEISEILKQYGLTKIQAPVLGKIGYIKASIPDDRDLITVIKDIRKEHKLKIPEPNYIANILTISDPLYKNQWYVPDTNFDKAWEKIKSTSEVKVAVIDTGVSATHPDLKGKILKGYDFINNTESVIDANGHGTFIAGVIAAQANNVGIRGLYDFAQIIPVKVINQDGIGTYEDAAKGIIWATDQGAKVINLSIGGYAYSYLLQDAVDYALEKGCIVVAAGGNDGIEQEIYPAAYPDVIGVSALSYNGKIWSGSNSGKHIDVAAPGAGILSTGIGEDYVYAMGTSAAAAMASALAAMLVSESPDLSSSIIERLIMQSAKDLGEKGRDKIYGSGEIDALASLGQEVKSFHDVAVRSVHVEPMVFEKGKQTYISVDIANKGTYKSEKCDVVLYEIIGEEKKEVEKKVGIVLVDKTNVVFGWKPDSPKNGLKFEVVALLSIDENESNNSKISNMFSLGESGNKYVLYKVIPPVHQWVALQAYNALPGGSLLKNEMQDYLPTSINSYWTNLRGENFGYYGRNIPLGIKEFSRPLQSDLDFNKPYEQYTALIEGTWEEDCDFGFRYKNHFWDPDVGYNEGLIGFDSALNKAVVDRFKTAIEKYNTNNKTDAYYWLGRTAHLLMDMTVPEHVHNDWHIGTDMPGDGDSSYENYTAKYYKNVTSLSLSPINIDTLPLSPPPTYSSVSVPSGYDGSNYFQSKLVKLFYNTAQYAQFFDSDDVNGNETNAQNMKTAWGVTSDNGTKNTQYLGVLNIGEPYGIDSVVSVYWDKTWPRTDISLVYGKDFDFTTSLSSGKIYLSNTVFNEANNILNKLDSFIIVYTADAQQKPPVTKLNIDEDVTDIPEDYLISNHQKLQGFAIKAVAALYQLFWEKTHPDITSPTITMIAPHAGDTISGSVNVNVTASDSSGISKVEYYLNAHLAFTDYSGPSYTWSWPTANYTNGQYNLIAKAYDTAGNAPGVSSPVTVTVNNSSGTGNNKPNVPASFAQYKSDGTTLISSGTTTNEQKIDLKAVVTDPDKDNVSLEVEVQPVGNAFTGIPSTNCTPGTVVVSGSTASVTCSALSNVKYHWQARSKDSKGARSLWQSATISGNELTFIVKATTTSTNYPPSVTVMEPNGGETLTIGTPFDIKWSATDITGTIQKINLYESTDGGVNYTQIQSNLSNTGLYTWTPSHAGTMIRIKVEAVDTDGLPGWDTSDRNLSVSSLADNLSAPTIQPISVSGGSYTVSWSQVNNATSYILQEDNVSNSFTNTVTVYSGTDTSWTVINKVAGTYYYRVKAVNSYGSSTWSDSKSATIQVNQGPGNITVLEPVDGATNQPLNITLSWNAASGGGGNLRYNVYVCYALTDTYFTNNIKSSDQTTTSFSLQNLPYNTEISWGIEAIDDTGNTKYSKMFHFKTLQDTALPTGTLNINNGATSTASYSVTLNLTATDSGSGVQYMRFSNDGTHWDTWWYFAPQYQWSLANFNYGGAEGKTSYTVYAQFRDAQGNESAVYSATIAKTSGTPGQIILNGTVYETIRDAINAAKTGETVYLTEGIYTIYGDTNPAWENGSRVIGLMMKPGVTLKGAGAEKTLIQMPSSWSGGGLYTIIDADNAVIEGLTVSNPLQSSLPYAILVVSNSSKIRNCIIKGSYGGIQIGWNSSLKPSNSEISNNLIIGNHEGIRGFDGTNVSILNNTIAYNNMSGIASGPGLVPLAIKNNIIVFNGVGIGTDGTLPTIQYNDVYGNVQGSYNENYQGISDQTGSNGNKSADPSFVNSTAGNYQLASFSPCINIGTNVGIPYSGNSADMGAFEYNGAGTIQVTSNRSDASFTVKGPDGYTANGSGINWTASSMAIGIYTISFTSVANYYSPSYQSMMLYSGQTLVFDGSYKIDTVGPSGKVMVNFGEYSTAKELVAITVDITDKIAGMGTGAQMMFSNDGQIWSTAEPFSSVKKDWDLTAYGSNRDSGTKMVYAKVSDSLGNWSTFTASVLYVPNRKIFEVPTQYSAIQAAIDAAQDGDMVYVLPGTYTGSLTMKPGVKLQGAGASQTFLEKDSGSGTGVTTANNGTIDGFTICKTGCYSSISVAGSASVISNNIVHGFRGIAITGSSKPIIRNNVLKTNGYGILAFGQGSEEMSIIIQNNTITNISMTVGSTSTVGIYLTNATPLTKLYSINNIIANNGIGVNDYMPSDSQHQHIFSSFNTYWNNASGNFGSGIYNKMEAGDRTNDPSFVDAVNGDYHLNPGSPCIGSGNPDAAYNNADNSRADRGAYGGQTLKTNPMADFSISPITGGTSDIFNFDASLSHDRESKDDKLQVRWDVEGDGVYDTLFSSEKIFAKLFDLPGAYNISMQVKDEDGYISTVTKSVSVKNQSPNIPQSPTPNGGVIIKFSDVVLSWTGGDPDFNDVVRYDFYFGTTSNPPLVSADQPDSFYTTGQLDSNSTYYWKVVAKDRSGASSISPAWNFSTGYLDVEPPIGSVVINDGGIYANSPTVNLSISATDYSGVSEMCISNIPTCSSSETYAKSKIWSLLPDDGAKIIYVKFKDIVGNWSNAFTVTVTLDTTAPITTASPAGGTYNASQSITLTCDETATIYYTTNANDPVESFKVYATSIPIDATTTLRFYAKDTAGNSETIKTQTYTIDKILPALELSTLANGSATNNQVLNISGKLTDNLFVQGLKINDKAVDLNGDGTFSYSLTLSSGSNVINTVATDNAGNTKTDIRTIIYDPNAPVLTISAPADNSKTKNQTVTVTGTADETSTVGITLTGGTIQQATMADNSFSLTLTLASGTNTIEVTATDLAGNKTSAKRTVVYDPIAPSLAITAPGQDIRTKLNQYTLNGTVTDLTAVALMMTVTDVVDPISLPVIDSAFEYVINLAADKPYVIEVTATDEVGNQSKVSRNIIRDTLPPTLSIDALTVLTNQTSQLLSGTREANATIIISSVTATAGDVVYPTDTSWQVTISNLKEGNNTITFNTKDIAGNETTSIEKTIMLDTSPPAFSLNPVKTPTHQASQILTGSREAGAIVSVSCATAAVGTITYGQETTWSVTLSDLSQGENAITLKANDPAGNESTITTAITFSKAIPGDINDDKNVNIMDAIIALRLTSRLPVDPAVTMNIDADVNNDTRIGMEEVIYIMQKAAGLR